MLNIAEEIPNWSFYRFGNSKQGLDGNNFFAAFNFTDVFWVQIHSFGQFFLRKTSLFAARSYCFTDNFPMLQNELSLFLCHGKRLPGLISDIHQQHAGILDFA